MQKIELKPEEAALISEIEAAIAPLRFQQQGALTMAIRSRGLKGNWTYRDGCLHEQPGPGTGAPPA